MRSGADFEAWAIRRNFDLIAPEMTPAGRRLVREPEENRLKAEEPSKEVDEEDFFSVAGKAPPLLLLLSPKVASFPPEKADELPEVE